MARINRDFTYCGGYGCRLTAACRRFNMAAFDKSNQPLYWVPPAYDEEGHTCQNFVKDID